MSEAFEPKYKDYCVVQLLGSGRVIVKDNHGVLTSFHRKDVKPIDMDIKITELFQEEHNTNTRDANHTMPKVKIPDLGWKDYLPPSVNKLDYIAIEQGKVENLECNCTECHEEETQSIEIEEIQQATVVEKATVQPEVVSQHLFGDKLYQLVRPFPSLQGAHIFIINNTLHKYMYLIKINEFSQL